MTHLRMLIASLGVAGLLAGAVAPAAAGEPVTDKNNVISINPFPLIIGMISMEYERKLSPQTALPIAVNYWSFKLGQTEVSTYGGGVGYRWYFSPVALDGWYVEGQGNVQVVSLTVTEALTGLTGEGSGVVFGPAAVVGREWVWQSGFVLNLALGVTYYAGKVEATAGNYTASADVSGTGFTGRFSLGYAWQ